MASPCFSADDDPTLRRLDNPRTEGRRGIGAFCPGFAPPCTNLPSASGALPARGRRVVVSSSCRKADSGGRFPPSSAHDNPTLRRLDNPRTEGRRVIGAFFTEFAPPCTNLSSASGALPARGCRVVVSSSCRKADRGGGFPHSSAVDETTLRRLDEPCTERRRIIGAFCTGFAPPSTNLSSASGALPARGCRVVVSSSCRKADSGGGSPPFLGPQPQILIASRPQEW